MTGIEDLDAIKLDPMVEILLSDYGERMRITTQIKTEFPFSDKDPYSLGIELRNSVDKAALSTCSCDGVVWCASMGCRWQSMTDCVRSIISIG